MNERLLNAANRFYVVQKGDCLSVIAEKLSVPISALTVLRKGIPVCGLADTIFPGDLVGTYQ